MTDVDFNCSKICKNSCASLNEALRRETSQVRFYEGVMEQCNTQEIAEFLGGIIDERRKTILTIIQKLNEIHARSSSTDGVISSFNS